MNSLNRLALAFNVRPGEGRLVLSLLAGSAFIGMARIFADTAASTLFLVKVGAQALPYLYMGMAVTTPFTGFIYSKFGERLSFGKLLTVTFSGLFLFLVALRVWLGLTQAGWPAMVLALGYDVLYVFTSIAFWGLAGRVFNVRQGKRLFGLIGAGEVVAIVAGGFLIPVLVRLIGTPNLLLLAAAGMAGALVVLATITRASAGPASSSTAEEAPAHDKRTSASLLKNRYIVLLFVFVSLSFLQTYVLDNAFYNQVNARYPEENQLAGFVGVFLAVAGFLTLGFRVLVTGRVISRYGAQAGLLMLSVLLVIGSAAVAVTGSLFGATVLVFWVVAGTKLTDKVWGNSVYQSSFLVLYQPLPADQRLRAQTVVESIVEPLAIGAAGLGLLILRALFAVNVVHLAYALLLILAALIVVTIRLGREYQAALLQALTKRKLSGSALLVADGASLSALRQGLQSPHAGVVIYSLNTLEEIEHESLAKVLLELLGHPAPEVRQDALVRIERLGLAPALEAVRHRAELETVAPVRGAALRTLAALGEDEAVEQVSLCLDDPEPQVRLGAMVGLLRSGGIEGVLAAGEKLIEQVNSATPAERALAAQALGELGLSSFYRPLLKLLRDDNPLVRRAALASAGRIKNPKLWPLVIEGLALPTVRTEAASALAAGGAAVLPELEAAFARNAGAPEILVRVARTCGRIGGDRAVALLRGQIGHPDGQVRSQVVAALSQCGYRAGDKDGGLVQQQIRAEAAQAALTLAALADVGDDEAVVLLNWAFHHQLDQIRQRFFFLLSFIYDPRSILQGRDNLASVASAERRAYAFEVLDVLLAQDLKGLVFPLLEDLSVDESLRRLSAFFPQPSLGRERRLAAIITRPDEFTPWTKACALEVLARSPAGDSVEVAISALNAPDPLVREAAVWAIIRLDPAAARSRLAALLDDPNPQVALAAGQVDGRQQGDATMLSTIEKVLILKSVSLFSQTPDDILAEVGSLLEEVEVRAGETIFMKGDTGRCLYIVVDGRVRVHDGERTLNYLGEGTVFGEMAVLDAAQRSASVTASEDGRLFRLDQDPLYELIADRSEVARGIIHVLTANLRARVKDVDDLHSRLERLSAEDGAAEVRGGK